jgi:glutathione S-transferase
MKLMYSPASPFVRKVRACAIELGLDDKITLEYTKTGPTNKNAVYADTVNPLRKIPSLVLEDGKTALFDSVVICEYLDALAGGNRIIPKAGDDRWRVLTQHAVAQGMCEALLLARYETTLRTEAKQWPSWVDDQLDRFWTGLDWFEGRAASALSSRMVDLSQVTLACCVGYLEFRFPEAKWAPRAPQIAAWYKQMLTRPSLAKTMPQNPPS